MRILMMGTLTNSMNGSARSFVRLCNFLAAKHEVYVIVPDKDGVVSLLSSDISGLIVKKITPVRRSIAAILGLPAAALRLFSIIKQHQPDVVHINDIPWFYGVLISRMFKTPVVIHSRYYEKNKFIKKIISMFLARANAVVYVSDFNRSMWGLNQEANITLHNPGIFNFKFDNSLTLPTDYALVVSRISEEKGILEAIQLFYLLTKRDDVTKLVIAGDAMYDYQKAYLEECKKLLKTLNIEDRVIWLGHITMPHQLYANTKLYIHLPNFEDPFPTTVMEALALGARIVTNGRGGIKEQIAGFDGTCLISPETANEEAAQKLNQFLDSTELRYDRAKLYQQRFNEQQFYERFEKILVGASH